MGLVEVSILLVVFWIIVPIIIVTGLIYIHELEENDANN